MQVHLGQPNVHPFRILIFKMCKRYVKAFVYIGLGKQASFALGVNAESAIILLV